MEIKVPLNGKAQANAANGTLTLTANGVTKVQRYNPHWVEVTTQGGEMVVKTVGKETRGKRAIAMSLVAHAKNASAGETHSRKLQLVYAHFPVTVEVKGKEVLFKNFLGEKLARKAKIIGSAKVEVKGQELTVTGQNVEDVGQTASNLRQCTRITNKDIRVFQDGVYYL